jgi:hypothetical protein
MKTEVSLGQKPYGAEETGESFKVIFEASKSTRAIPLTNKLLLKSQNSN